MSLPLILTIAWTKVLKATATISQKLAVWSYLIPGITANSFQETLGEEVGSSGSITFTVPTMDQSYEFDVIQKDTEGNTEWYYIRLAVHGVTGDFTVCATAVSSMALNLAEFIGASVDYDAKTIELGFESLTDFAVTVTVRPNIVN